MTGEIKLKNIPAQLALAVHARVKMGAIAEKMGAMFGAVMGHAGKTGAHFAGPPFVLYPELPSDEFPIVVCMPVAPGAIAGDGVTLEELPACEAATLVYQGPYDRMEPSWRQLLDWVQRNSRTPSGPVREIYLNDPATCAPDELLTELVVPLR